MAQMRDVRDLEEPSALEFQERQWRVQRVAWVVMLLLLLAALAGLLGPGPLSQASISETLEYSRLLHYQAPAELVIRPRDADVSRGEIRLGVSRGYLGALEVRQITPEPDRVEIAGDRLEYVFEARGAGSPIRFEFEPARLGMINGWIELSSTGRLEFGQWVYP